LAAEPTKNKMFEASVGLQWSPAEKQFQAVLLRRRPEGIEFEGPKTISANSSLLESLRQQFRLPSDDASPVALSVGIDSSHVGFYRFEVPAVPDPQLVSIIRTQAEGYLPLPASSMRLAWRVDARPSENCCVLAAIRNELYEQLIGCWPDSQPLSAVPDIVGLTACWQAFCPSSHQESVLLKLTRTQAAAILVEEGRILNAARLDVDLDGPFELLKTDVIQLLESISPQIRSKPIFLWENQENPFPDLSEELKSEGFQIQHCSPLPEKIRRFRNLTVQTAASYPEALGLALLALDGASIDFDFTIELTEPAPTLRQQIFSAPVRRTALSLLLAAVVCTVGLYWKDKTELRLLQKQLTAAEKGQSAQQMLQMMEFRKQVAAARPDIIELLEILRQSQPEGLILDQFLFERGKPVELRGTAGSYEQAYEFLKNLQKRNELRQAQLLEPTLDEKTKKVTFRIRFLYRNFSG